jgi:lipid-binding SYLF domain-containing protein
MEWMLQVADDIDDALGAVRLASIGWAAEIGLVAAGSLGIGAIIAAMAAGAELPLICAGSIALGLGAGVKLHGWQLQNGR